MILKTLELLKSEADPRALKNVLEMRNKQKNAPIIVSKDCKRVRQNINKVNQIGFHFCSKSYDRDMRFLHDSSRRELI